MKHKRRIFAAVFLASLIFCSFIFQSCASKGDDIDIGDASQPDVSVSFKDEEPLAPDILYDYSDMIVIFDAIAKLMIHEGVTFVPSDSYFCWRTLTYAFSSMESSDNGVTLGEKKQYLLLLLLLPTTFQPLFH